MLALVLGLAAISYATYVALSQTTRVAGGAPAQTAPQQLENFREAARKIEADGLQRAAEAAQSHEGN